MKLSGMASARWITFDLKGNNEIIFSRALGEASNNQAEALVLLQGLKTLSLRGIKDPS